MMISHNNLIYYYPMITLSTTSADNIAQQILSTSLYLLRLVDDIYYRPAATNPERFSFILREYLKTAMAIMARFFRRLELEDLDVGYLCFLYFNL